MAYPTDSGLLAKAVRRIATVGRRVQAAGGATRTRIRDRSRSAGQRAREIGAKLRLRGAQTRDEAQAVVRRVTGELAGLAEKAAAEAEPLLVNARRALRRAQAEAAELATAGIHDAAAGRRRGRIHRAVNDLTDGSTRRVSLHDGDARPIAKGRLGKPVEFGYKAQVLDNDDATFVGMPGAETTSGEGGTTSGGSGTRFGALTGPAGWGSASSTSGPRRSAAAPPSPAARLTR